MFIDQKILNFMSIINLLISFMKSYRIFFSFSEEKKNINKPGSFDVEP